MVMTMVCVSIFFFQAEDGIRDVAVTGVQTCALPILRPQRRRIRGPDAPRSWPHDLGRDGTPWVRTVRPGARRDVPARSVGSAVPERQVSTAVAPQRIGYRWAVCALLFVVTTINYVDRQVLGFLAAGRLFDRIGVRRGFAAAVVAWSLAAIAHAFARTTALFSAARALLGVAESANFPGAIKAVAEWFPKKERALATGIFNAGTNTGAIITPLLVPWIALTWGWQWAFIATGSLGFLWLLLWLAVYRSPESNPRISRDELAHIRSDPPDLESARVPWIRLLGFRQTWAVAAGKLLADPIWWFYLIG